MEKIWTSDELLKEYIVEKIRMGYETRYSIDELADYLDFISYYVKTSLDQSTSRYGDVVQKYVAKENEKPNKVIDDTLSSRWIFPTYQLHFQPKCTDEKKVETDENVSEEALEDGITSYLQRNGIKRTIDSFERIDDKTRWFADKATTALVLHIWSKKIKNEIAAGRWPIQCGDVSKFILETDLANIIKLPPMRDELISFYTTVCDRMQHVAAGDPNFRMTNIEGEVLSKSNFDLIMDGFSYFNTKKGGCDVVDVSRVLNVLKHDDNKLEEWLNLDTPRILKLSGDIKNARRTHWG